MENSTRVPSDGAIDIHRQGQDDRPGNQACTARHAVRCGGVVAGIAGRIRPHYAWAYALMSNLAFLAYGLDKSAAVADRWRWSEKALHWIELLCGWPGALIGQHAFRHKSRKASFLFFTWLASAANAAVFAHLAGFYRWSWQ